MKSHCIFYVSKAEYSDLEIALFQKFARLFLAKVRKELELVEGDSTTEAKRKTHAKYHNTIRTLKFVRKLPKIIDKNLRKSINAIAKELKVSRHSVGRIAHVIPNDVCNDRK